MEFTAKQLAAVLEGELVGNAEEVVNSFAPIENGKKGSITFLSNPKYESYIYDTEASVVVRNKSLQPKQEIPTTQIIVEDSYHSFTVLLRMYEEYTNKRKSGIDEKSIVHQETSIEEGVYIGPFTVVSKGVRLGKNVEIFPNCFIDENVTIGDNTTIYSGCVILKDTVIGKSCTIYPNCTLGSPGFGYAKNKEGEYQKIPQLGNVVLEDEVDIGAGTTVDRATMDSTIIRKGCKLDNQIQIGHNVEVGKNSVFASQAGIAGSSKIGENVMLGGQAGIAGHVEVGNNSIIMAQTGVGKNVPENFYAFGSPFLEHMNFKRSYALFRKLPELAKRIDQLEKELKSKETNG